MCLTLYLAISALTDGFEDGSSLLGLVWIALLPLAVTPGFVIPAALIIGLPTTAILRRYDMESVTSYVAVGAVCGFLLPIGALLLSGALGGYWTCVFGALSGAVTGHTWWRSARAPLVG